MIEGRFGDTSGRPYIEGRLSLPRLGNIGNISFIFDTGADMSLLMPLDAGRLKIDYTMLQGTANATGIGGYSRHFVEPAILAFADSNKVIHAYFIQIRIASPSPEVSDIPSLLGRDIIDKWEVIINKRDNVLSAKVLTSDLEIPVNP